MPRKKGQKPYTPEQRARRKETVTKKAQEASKRKAAPRTTKGRYTPEEIEKFAVTPKELLTKYQRKIVSLLPHEKVTVDDIAKHARLDKGEVLDAVNRHYRGGIDTNSLEYIPGRGFFGKTGDDTTVVFVATRNPDDPKDYIAEFSTAKQLEESVRTKSSCVSPPCTNDGSAAEVVIFLKGGAVRSNIE